MDKAPAIIAFALILAWYGALAMAFKAWGVY